jgi:hypothetical protein
LMRGRGLMGLLATAALAIVLCWGGGGGGGQGHLSAPRSKEYEDEVWGSPCREAILASRKALTPAMQARALKALREEGERPECVDHLPALSLQAPAAMRRWPGIADVQVQACALIESVTTGGASEVGPRDTSSSASLSSSSST